MHVIDMFAESRDQFILISLYTTLSLPQVQTTLLWVLLSSHLQRCNTIFGRQQPRQCHTLHQCSPCHKAANTHIGGSTRPMGNWNSARHLCVKSVCAPKSSHQNLYSRKWVKRPLQTDCQSEGVFHAKHWVTALVPKPDASSALQQIK